MMLGSVNCGTAWEIAGQCYPNTIYNPSSCVSGLVFNYQVIKSYLEVDQTDVSEEPTTIQLKLEGET